MPDDNAYPEESQPNSLEFIAAEVRKYHKAFQEEFEAIQTDDVVTLRTKVKEKFGTKLLSFVETIIDLSENSESEGTRLSAAKFGLSFVLGDLVEDPKHDPMNQLITALTKKTEKELTHE